MPIVNIAGKDHEVQRFDLNKALRVITLLNVIQKLVPDVAEELAVFARQYREQHLEILDRVQAKMRYGGDIPVVSDDGEPVVRDGKVLTVPAPIERMTEADWERSGHKLTRPEDPSMASLVAAVFPMIAERAEQPMMMLLAVCITPNDDFRRYVRDDVWQEKAQALAEESIGPAYLEEVVELAVTVGETIEGQVLSKLDEIGDRVGKLRNRLPGNRRAPVPTESDPGSASTVSASTTSGPSSSPTSTDGAPTSSEPSPGAPSSPSLDIGETAETPKNSSVVVSVE